jgi:hypothetical protein
MPFERHNNVIIKEGMKILSNVKNAYQSEHKFILERNIIQKRNKQPTKLQVNVQT